MLTICPTPIGNLGDATPRQREALESADVIACEDTRTTGKLLELLGIARDGGRPQLVAYHEHNESVRAAELKQRLEQGERVVLVSDAGTPGISDPGYRLVRAARAAGAEVTVLPGPVAAVLALVGSGLPTDRWVFEGFAPAKAGARRKALERARQAECTAVFYESPHRVVDFLADVSDVFGPEVETCVARELTKLHEEWFVGAASEVTIALEGRDRLRGEFVVVVGAAESAPHDDVDRWIAALHEAGVAPATIKRVVAQAAQISKSEVWARLEKLKT